MLKIKLTPRAYSDLEEIFEYTFVTWGITQAEYYQDNLFEAMELVASDYKIGKIYHYHGVGYRFFHVNKHPIFYQTQNNNLVIVRILHERMNLNSRL